MSAVWRWGSRSGPTTRPDLDDQPRPRRRSARAVTTSRASRPERAEREDDVERLRSGVGGDSPWRERRHDTRAGQHRARAPAREEVALDLEALAVEDLPLVVRHRDDGERFVDLGQRRGGVAAGRGRPARGRAA